MLNFVSPTASITLCSFIVSAIAIATLHHNVALCSLASAAGGTALLSHRLIETTT